MGTIISKSPEQTGQIARQFASTLRPGSVIGVAGELGAGKTHFIKGAALGLGFHGAVTSPTFTLVHEYPTENGPVFHIDLFRVTSDKDAASLGLDEIFGTASATFIEWPERLENHLPADILRVRITIDSDSNRKIELPEQSVR